LADGTTDATETTEADEADVAEKPGDAEEAKADKTNKAEADEADAEADDAVEAIVIDAANYAIVTDKPMVLPLLPHEIFCNHHRSERIFRNNRTRQSA
jgi:hypothetical protein